MGYRKDTTISDETLIGYILASLPEEELAFIEDQILRESLAGQTSLTQRIVDLRDLLRPIQAAHSENFEPASDLVSRTLGYIGLPNSGPNVPEKRSSSIEASDRIYRETGYQSESASYELSSAPNSKNLANSNGTAGAANGLHPFTGGSEAAKSQDESGNGRRVLTQVAADERSPVAWFDSLATLAVCMVVVCLVLPGVWNAREQSRRIVCAEKLRSLGLAMHDFANLRDTGEFPKIDMNGTLSFAGVYAIRLKDADLIQDASQVWCPANSEMRTVAHLPSTEQYNNSTHAERLAWRRAAGGTYAYNLGYVDNGHYITPTLNSPANRPIIGDFAYFQDFNPNVIRTAHGQDTSNIVYVDGRVQSLRFTPWKSRIDGEDNPFLNDNQERAAGLNINDSCLAPSFVAPFRSQD